MKSALIFDIETVRPVRVAGEAEWPGIEYASSWEDYLGMGIACIGAFDTIERRFRVFGANSLRHFRQLMRDREQVVGWNNHHFDNRLLEAHGVAVDPAASFDLMTVFPSRVGLERTAKANGLPAEKSMPGKEAPIRWQQGRCADVIDYCLSDVWMTTALYVKYLKGTLVNPYTGQPVRVTGAAAAEAQP
jgi:hypothetical protein